MRDNPDKTGIAVDDNAAVKVKDGKIIALKSGEDGKAYIADIVNEEFKRRELSEGEQFPVEEL